MSPINRVGGTFAPASLVVCATFLAYLPALSGDFIWNDSDYVTAPALRSVGGLGRIWTTVGATEQYYPLLHSAFWVEHRLWGDHPLGYHLVTLCLHAASAILFALVLRRLWDAPDSASPPSAPLGAGRAIQTGGGGGSTSEGTGGGRGVRPGAEWLAAGLFALHPVHVESVAWITEQKNTLSLGFYLLAAFFYLDFDRSRRPRAYVSALALFLLSLGCKTVTSTLPAALLVALWWKRGRLDLRRDVAPLLPWIVIGAGAGIFSSWVERAFGEAQGPEFALTFLDRVLIAGRAVWFYAGKLVWPSGLNFLYPRWTVDASVRGQWLFPAGVALVIAGLWAIRRKHRGPLAAALFFVGSLFPVLGFVNLYGARYSWVWDHWQYLPDLGPMALAAAAITGAWDRTAVGARRFGIGLAAAGMLLLGSLTWAHCGLFRDDLTLYRRTIERNPGAWLAHFNLGVILQRTPGRMEEARSEYESVIRLKPDHAKAHYNLGLILDELPGRSGEAIAHYEEAVRLQPHFVEARNNLGEDYARSPGRLNEAVAQYQEAIRLQPDFFAAHNNLGNALLKTPGRLDDAIAEYREALRLRPQAAAAHLNLAIALLNRPGGAAESKEQLETCLRLQPDNELARRILTQLLAKTQNR